MINKLLQSPTRIRDIENELGLNNISRQLHQNIKEIVQKKYSEQLTQDYLYRLHSFALITNTKFSHLHLANKDYSSFFSNFVYFINEGGFSIPLRKVTSSINITKILVKELNNNFNCSIVMNGKPSLSLDSFCPIQLKYHNGWFYKHKTSHSKEYLNLYQYCELFGLEEANEIEKIIQSIQNFKTDICIFNLFIKCLTNNKISLFTALGKDILHSFMKQFFNDMVEQDKCLIYAKSSWNILIRTLQEYFQLSKDFKLSLTRESKNPNNMNLININGKLVKNKLITHIPLEINDDKALFLIKNKIKQDLDLIREWAIFNLKEFNNNLNESKFITRNELYSIFILLVLENPSITESFLTTLKNQNSYIKINDKFFLVGYKARKGNSLAEQKIALSDFSVEIIDKYLDWISNFKKDNDSFFIYKGFPQIVYYSLAQKTSLYGSNIKKYFRNFLKDKNLPEDYINELVKNACLSKIRASAAIQIYFETENTTKMAEALGHTHYNPKLLSHYLPQSILEFYQQRWIRIFQKGLICEALKNNPLIFKASNFENIEQLDEFLKHHMLKNIPDNLSSLNNVKTETEAEFDNIYVSINKENLTALFSLKKAIEQSQNKEKIYSKAYFWFHFSEQLEKEILSKREYTEFKDILNISKKTAEPSNFNQVIYE